MFRTCSVTILTSFKILSFGYRLQCLSERCGVRYILTWLKMSRKQWYVRARKRKDRDRVSRRIAVQQFRPWQLTVTNDQPTVSWYAKSGIWHASFPPCGRVTWRCSLRDRQNRWPTSNQSPVTERANGSAWRDRLCKCCAVGDISLWLVSCISGEVLQLRLRKSPKELIAEDVA